MSGLSKSDVNEILALVENSNFTELRIETGDLKIELRRGGAPSAPLVAAEPDTSAKPGPVATPIATASARPASVDGAGSGTAVPAPMLGIFYHSPKPGDAPFVKAGDAISRDTIIGVIEVMKLMNSISAGVNGTVIEIVAPNGVLVEHGDPLIRVKVA